MRRTGARFVAHTTVLRTRSSGSEETPRMTKKDTRFGGCDQFAKIVLFSASTAKMVSFFCLCLLVFVATPARATSLCASGRAQSPINIQTAALAKEARPDAAVSTTLLQAHYHPCAAAVGAGKDPDGDMVRFTGDFGDVVFPNGVYHAKEVHVHSPGEHLVDDVRSVLELHIVHERRQPPDGGGAGEDGGAAALKARVAVVAVRFVDGDAAAAHALISELVALMPRKVAAAGGAGAGHGGGHGAGQGQEGGQGRGVLSAASSLIATAEREKVVGIDLGSALQSVLAGGYYRYVGSLTTEPCTEGVAWYVMKETPTVSKAQRGELRKAQRRNSRPAQPLNGRVVRDSGGR